ncbi:MAG: hypothetical protein PHP25_00410 [Candidatus Moranbacteria bacterium]|nr:hypothetical protein [Candidatus Moranbacteria bacterium]
MDKKKGKLSEEEEIPPLLEISPDGSEKAMLDGLKSEHACHVVFTGGGAATETHYPPSRIRGGGTHIQVGEGFVHRELPEVLEGRYGDPQTVPGGRFRDVGLHGREPEKK